MPAEQISDLERFYRKPPQPGQTSYGSTTRDGWISKFQRRLNMTPNNAAAYFEDLIATGHLIEVTGD